MCGIVAGYGRADEATGKRMLARLVHRGPDDEGAVQVGGAWLGHRRLSIVDLGGGRQPLANDAGDFWLVGNGEIYNHEVVRGELGEEFTTRSDNEAALRLVDAKGPGALSSLEGMYAFVAAGADGRFIAARDPVGIKPLYWARRDDQVVFASEMRAFDPEWRETVEAFPPGHYWTPEGGLARFAVPVTAVRNPIVAGGSGEEEGIPERILTETREVLCAAVESQMMGDVRVGVFLSGGLDSSIVAAIASDYLRARGQRLITFAVGTADSSDLAAARRVSAFLDTEHHERVYGAAEALERVPEVVRTIEHFDPSLVRSAVPNLMVAELAAEHVKVVLTGEGADEIFAGYEYLSEIDDPAVLHAEIVRIIEGLHNLNLQRCDRVTMANGLEARVPFLDRSVIASGLRLPPALKLAGPGVPEKRVLREAFRGWLPEDILWRVKEEFGDGSGAADVLTDRLEASISDAEFEAERAAVDPHLRTKEELAYYRIWREHLGAIDPDVTLGRFATA